MTGAGSLAAAALHAISVMPGRALTVILIARGSERAHWLVRAANARAAGTNRCLRIRHELVDWDDRSRLRALFSCARPRVVLHTATLQSPWTVGGADAWSRMISEVGYGVTLPLHFVLAERAGRTLAESAPGALFVNACYPDAVNALLASEEVPVACGIGNVAILAAHLAAELPAGDEPLRLLAHHAHIAAAINGTAPSLPPRAWLGRTPVNTSDWVASARLPNDDRLNSVTGATAAPLLLALLERHASYRGHAPGVQGLPGGYPVVVKDGVLSLDLPEGVSRDEAVDFNRRSAVMDGLVAGPGDWVRFSDATLERLERVATRFGVRFPRSFAAEDLRAQARDLLRVRSILSA